MNNQNTSKCASIICKLKWRTKNKIKSNMSSIRLQIILFFCRFFLYWMSCILWWKCQWLYLFFCLLFSSKILSVSFLCFWMNIVSPVMVWFLFYLRVFFYKFWLCRYEIYFKANKINSCSIIIMSIANSFFCFMLIWVLRPFCFLHLFLHFFRMSVLAAADRDFVHRFLSFCFFFCKLRRAPTTKSIWNESLLFIIWNLEQIIHPCIPSTDLRLPSNSPKN